MEEQPTHKQTPPEASESPVQEDTKHEAHPHAPRRVWLGFVAVGVVALLVVIWSKWSEPIKEFCFGEDGACPVEIDPALLEEGAAFAVPNDASFEDAAE